MTRKTKLEKLREDLKQKIQVLDETWKIYEKERKSPNPKRDSLEFTEKITTLVGLTTKIVSKSNDALYAYGAYTAALKKKLDNISRI